MSLINKEQLQQQMQQKCYGDCNHCHYSGNHNNWICGLIEAAPVVPNMIDGDKLLDLIIADGFNTMKDTIKIADLFVMVNEMLKGGIC